MDHLIRVGVFVGGTLAAGLCLLLRQSERRVLRKFDETLETDLFAVLYEFLKPLEWSECEVRSFIRRVLEGSNLSAPSADIPDLLRIEYELAKTDGNSVRRTVGLLFMRNGEPVVKKCSRTISWENLPAKFRHEFVEKVSKALNFVLYPVVNPEVSNGVSR